MSRAQAGRATPLVAVLMLSCPLASVRAYDTVRFLDPIKAQEKFRPVAAAAGNSRLYVLDAKKSSVLIFDASGRLVKEAAGADSEALSRPRGLAVAPDGRVYVADAGSHRVQVLGPEGEFRTSFGGKGSEAGRLRAPESVAVGSDGRVYVADTGNNRVQVFTGDGILLFQFGGGGKEPGRFNAPSRVAVDLSDNVYVLDRGNARLQRFDPAARFERELPLPGGDFVVDPYGFLYVLDGKLAKVIELDSSGSVQGRLGSSGSGVGQFKKPEGLALGPDGGLLVLDTGNGRILPVAIENKQKTAFLPPNLSAKVLVSGPSRSVDLSASALAARGSELYAYLPDSGQFVILDEEGKEKARFGGRGAKGPGATKSAGGLAVSSKLGLFVSDTPNDRIQQFSLEGVWKANLAEKSGLFDSRKKEGRVRDPRGVAINEQGTIYVADAGNRRIDAFSPEGAFLFGIGPKLGPHELQEPVAVAWDKARFVYFLDKGLKKVFKCEPSGALIAAWGEEGSGPGQLRSPQALAFDGHGYLYVLDADSRRVSVFARDGRWMTDLFAGGEGPNELSAPAALALQGRRLVIADKGKGKILSFDLHPRLAPPAQISTATREGVVLLSWPASADPWAERYRVYRATGLWGPYAERGAPEAPRFEDAAVSAYETYFYRVATVARTKDAGAPGNPVEVFVAGAFNRSPIEFSTVAVGNIFSANYKWYLKNPVGGVSVTNNANLPFRNVKLTFRLKDFMDFGYDTEIRKLDPQETVELPLIATLNNRILGITEDTPVQAELSLAYFESGKPQTVSLTKPLRVYSRNAITWDNPERIANFITPKDTPVLEFGREALRQAPALPKAEALNRNLVAALHLWDALSEHGVKFFTNPSNPYETVSEDPNFPVDYAQFPRETLKRKSGQCDDLVTLMISMLEATKVRSAILDYPGHMALMIDTEAQDPAEAGLPEESLVLHAGTYWVPIEATLIGRPFPEAARKAAYAYKAESEQGKVRVIEVRRAWQSFEPATLPESDWSAEVPSQEARGRRFAGEVEDLFESRYKFLKKHYGALLKEDPASLDARVELGLLEHQAGNKDKAAEEFNKALAFEPRSAAALNNLGNLAFLSGDYAAAQEKYLKASEAEPEDPEIWLNLLKAGLHLKEREKAREYGKKAVQLEARLAPTVDTLLKWEAP